MTPTTQHESSIDVTGLPEEAVRAVEAVVALLRGREGTGRTAPPSYEEWSRALRAWAADHPRLDTLAEDDRESIYAGRGE